jgi:heterodisulfide reductase subunit A
MSEKRIGLWVCECGGNISDVVETNNIEETLKEEVSFIKVERYLCSKPSVDAIKETVEDQKLNGVILACCTPNMHKKTFMSNLEEKGINPALLEIVNIREQCSWVHKNDHEGATKKV